MDIRGIEVATAKLFAHGRSQAVRLPKEFRMPGTEVFVSRQGRRVILEPIEPEPFDQLAWRVDLRALGGPDFLADGRPEQPEMPDAPLFD